MLVDGPVVGRAVHPRLARGRQRDGRIHRSGCATTEPQGGILGRRAVAGVANAGRERPPSTVVLRRAKLQEARTQRLHRHGPLPGNAPLIGNRHLTSLVQLPNLAGHSAPEPHAAVPPARHAAPHPTRCQQQATLACAAGRRSTPARFAPRYPRAPHAALPAAACESRSTPAPPPKSCAPTTTRRTTLTAGLARAHDAMRPPTRPPSEIEPPSCSTIPSSTSSSASSSSTSS